ncbi:beta-carotene 15,15'-monooxygenase [Arcanobacterium phocisimile]|uniref:Beta-carotene 15,15'-monooxygenase n=1 Tax=Arcanobacterium phocisimile TaxID=1302235 RepID=A0ABX7IEP9_9ACTO|nr:beta-carotene 15,15'-monooxygenase [Arcanobacterium phocisimile]QRV01441.1 beta-carotene 15,15'-monooxygenase [Arcanobacterium phocisimile]
MKRSLLAGFSALAVSAGVGEVVRRMPLPTWDRDSYTGSVVSLTGGLQAVAGVLAGTALAEDGWARVAGMSATVSSAAAGYIDDHMEEQFSAQGKGFRGHLGALKRGRVTSGVAKIAIIGAGAAFSGVALEKPRHVRGLVIAGLDAAMIAGSANLINLLDLRPGRALKVTALGALPVACLSQQSRPAAVALIATCLGTVRDDLAGRTMLGDFGANVLGAQLGVLLTRSSSTPLKFALFSVISGLTMASEKISFSAVIDNNTFLRAIDQLGRH